MKHTIYCRFCDQLTTEEVKVINDKSFETVSSTEDCEDCREKTKLEKMELNGKTICTANECFNVWANEDCKYCL